MAMLPNTAAALAAAGTWATTTSAVEINERLQNIDSITPWKILSEIIAYRNRKAKNRFTMSQLLSLESY